MTPYVIQLSYICIILLCVYTLLQREECVAPWKKLLFFSLVPIIHLHWDFPAHLSYIISLKMHYSPPLQYAHLYYVCQHDTKTTMISGMQ